MPPTARTAEEIAAWMRSFLADFLDRPAEEISPEISFAGLGLDSASSVGMIMALEDWLGIELDPEILANQRTIAALSLYLAGQP